MAFNIDKEKCINCGACQQACPMGAISEVDGKRVIDSAVCISCGACKATCPIALPTEG